MADNEASGFDDSWAKPLWTLARHSPPALRLAFLTAALRFPLGRTALTKVVEYGSSLLITLPPGNPVRQAALRLATQVPLLTARETLRQMAEDPNEPDCQIVASALEEIGDISRVGALLQRARQGDEETYRLLAIAPLEQRLSSAEKIPTCPTISRADTHFWRALALGRLNYYESIGVIFNESSPLPELFAGNPLLAWEKISAIRPCPEALVIMLSNLLKKSEQRHHLHQLPTGHLRALRLTVGAMTGQTDAEGQPRDSKGFGPLPAPPPLQANAALRPLLTGFLAGKLPEYHAGQIAWMIAWLPTEKLIQEVVALILIDAVRSKKTSITAFSLLDILARAADYQSGIASSPNRPKSGLFELPLRKVTLIDDRTRMLRPSRMVFGRGKKAGSLDSPAPEIPQKSITARSSILIDTSHIEYERISSLLPGLESICHTQYSVEVHNIDDEAPSEMDAGDAASVVKPPLEGTASERPDHTPAIKMHTPQSELPAQALAPDVEQRVVHGRILNDGVERTTFLAGALNTFRCWIGMPADDGSAQADQPIPQIKIPEQGLTLSVELLWKDQDDQQHTAQDTIHLPASRTARSSDCDLHLKIPAAACYLSADVLFRYQGRVFEAVKIESAVLAAEEVAGPRDNLRIRVLLSRREVIALKKANPCAATWVFGEPADAARNGYPPASRNDHSTLRIFADGSNTRSYEIKSPDIALENLNNILFSAEKNLVRRRAGEPGVNERLDTEDEEVRLLLRDMARFGAYLYKRLHEQHFVDIGERIQLLDLDPDGLFPIEFVYSKGNPAEKATLCQSWQNLLEANEGHCPFCSHKSIINEGTGLAEAICPYGFWALSKIIERLDPGTAGSSSAPRTNAHNLPPISSAIFAASNKVPQTERDAAWETIKSKITDSEQVTTWPSWRQTINHRQPRLLIALPHHDQGAVEDYIEIGDIAMGEDLSRLRRSQITADYVNPSGDDPGPILLLLGCKTSTASELGYIGLVREFQRQKTTIVLGTVAQILGRHAAPLAKELVKQITAIEDSETDFGTIMRRVRREMLARGYLMGLCLVAVGDAEWRLTPLP
jgi:hypothetical protein